MTTPDGKLSYLPFRGHQTWFEVVGDLKTGRTPIVALHGGPGAAHNYLKPMEELVDSGWPVVFYDQLGCGESTHLPRINKDFWTIDLFLDELDALLSHLDIATNYHLFGQSWGGMLAAEHAIRQPLGLASLILSNSLASSAAWGAGAERLRAQLPTETLRTLERHETDGTTEDADYLAAVEVYYDRHVCRIPLPDFVKKSFDQMAADPTVYGTMWGPNEFAPIGTLKDWTVVDRLSAIEVPTLVICGEFDEATSECQQEFIEGIADVQSAVVAGGSHLSMVEQPEAYFRIVREFLSRVTR